MKLFSRNKTQESELVDKLVGSGMFYGDVLDEVLKSAVLKKELHTIVRKAWKDGASTEEIQRVYDENLARIKAENDDNDQFDSFLEYDTVDASSMSLYSLPIEILSFLEKMGYEPWEICTNGKEFKDIVIVRDGISYIFIGRFEEVLTIKTVKRFVSYANVYTQKIMSEITNKVADILGEDNQSVSDPTYLVLINELVRDEDIPSLIISDWAGQRNKAMVYNPKLSVLYGRNSVQMVFFKKELMKRGTLKDLPNSKKHFWIKLN